MQMPEHEMKARSKNTTSLFDRAGQITVLKLKDKDCNAREKIPF